MKIPRQQLLTSASQIDVVIIVIRTSNCRRKKVNGCSKSLVGETVCDFGPQYLQRFQCQ